MENAIQAVMFDLDGTLVRHTDSYILNTVGKTLSELGLKADEDFAYEFWYGSDRDKLIENRFRIPNMKFWSVFWKYDNPLDRAESTEVYEDVDILRVLMNKGIKRAIVTGALGKVASLEIQKLGNYNFDSIVANKPELGIKQKPYPDSLIICLKELSVKNTNAIYVGNSPEDAEASVSAGIRPIIILREGYNQFRNYDRLATTIHSLYEILDFVK